MVTGHLAPKFLHWDSKLTRGITAGLMKTTATATATARMTAANGFKYLGSAWWPWCPGIEVDVELQGMESPSPGRACVSIWVGRDWIQNRARGIEKMKASLRDSKMNFPYGGHNNAKPLHIHIYFHLSTWGQLHKGFMDENLILDFLQTRHYRPVIKSRRVSAILALGGCERPSDLSRRPSVVSRIYILVVGQLSFPIGNLPGVKCTLNYN